MKSHALAQSAEKLYHYYSNKAANWRALPPWIWDKIAANNDKKADFYFNIWITFKEDE